VFMDVANKTGLTNSKISSIGFDADVVLNGAGPAKNTIASMTYAWDTAVFAATNMGKVNGTASGSNWVGAKAVHVPVVAGPLYDAANGLGVGGPYHLGAFSFVAGPRTTNATGHALNSTYALKLKVNSLLITRVAQTGTPGDEMVSFGYNLGVADAAVNGSTSGATSATPDALIQVRMKCDLNGDGAVTALADAGGFNTAKAAVATIKQLPAYLWNLDANPTVTGLADAGLFNGAKAAPIP